MEIVGKVAATIQNVLGPEAEELGRATGVSHNWMTLSPARVPRLRVPGHFV